MHDFIFFRTVKQQRDFILISQFMYASTVSLDVTTNSNVSQFELCSSSFGGVKNIVDNGEKTQK